MDSGLHFNVQGPDEYVPARNLPTIPDSVEERPLQKTIPPGVERCGWRRLEKAIKLLDRLSNPDSCKYPIEESGL